jgi:hypothetical protein
MVSSQKKESLRASGSIEINISQGKRQLTRPVESDPAPNGYEQEGSKRGITTIDTCWQFHIDCDGNCASAKNNRRMNPS